MVNLAEREVGFASDTIGFPSIDGCHAIVLCTSSGLFGFHNFGGSGTASFDERSRSFATFVSQHFIAPGTLLHLYGTCFRNKRGYSDADKLAGWKAEMRAFATALGYSGPVSGYNLDKMNYGARSAYVEYRAVTKGCSVHCKPWGEMTYTLAPNNHRASHKYALAGSVKAQTAQIYDTITANTGLAINDVPKNQLDKFNV